jgi:hypothetical protein
MKRFRGFKVADDANQASKKLHADGSITAFLLDDMKHFYECPSLKL